MVEAIEQAGPIEQASSLSPKPPLFGTFVQVSIVSSMVPISPYIYSLSVYYSIFVHMVQDMNGWTSSTPPYIFLWNRWSHWAAV